MPIHRITPGVVEVVKEDPNLVKASEPIFVPTIRELFEEAKKKPQYLLKDTLFSGATVLVSGPSKFAKKSQLVYAMCMALTSGTKIGPFNPVNPNGVPVMYFQADNTIFGNTKQIKWLGKGMGVNVEDAALQSKFFFPFRERILLEKDNSIERVLKLIEATKAQLVVFDTVNKYTAFDENQAHLVGVVGRNLKRIEQATGASTLIIHHITKPTYTQKDGKAVEKDIDTDLRGSGAWGGLYDQHFGIRGLCKIMDDPLDITIRDKIDEEKKYVIEWVYDKLTECSSFEMLRTTDPENLERLAEQLRAALLGGQSATFREAASLMSTDKATTKTVLDLLMKQGLLKEVKGEYALVFND